MRPEKTVVIIGMMFFLVGGMRASDVKDEKQLIDEVLEKYIDSQGGRDRLASIRSLEIEGIMALDSQGLEIPVIQKLQSPDKVYTVQEFPVLGRIENRLNGTSGWEWHPIAGERPLDYTEVNELLDDANLQRDLNLKDEYLSIRLGSPEVIEEIETTHLILTDEEGKEEHWYFKPNGDLFQKIHIVSAGPESEFETTERYFNFKEEGGFRFPRTIRYINPAYVAELTISVCQINREIDQEVFKLPDYATGL